MNKILFAFTVTLLFTACKADSPAPLMTKSSQSLDKKTALEDIMKTIERETSCFFKRDFECWKNCYVDEAYAMQAWNNEDGTFDATVGYDTIAKHTQDYFAKYPLEKNQTASHPEVLRKNFTTKFYTDSLCYMIWDQYNKTERVNGYIYSKEIRLMEKRGADWKIVNVAAFWDYKNVIKNNPTNI